MAFELPLPEEIQLQGWKVKIRDKERVEPPHVSIMKKGKTWRWGLREQKFLDKQPPPREVLKDLKKMLKEKNEELAKQWDKMYPHNPVASQE